MSSEKEEQEEEEEEEDIGNNVSDCASILQISQEQVGWFKETVHRKRDGHRPI